jgi:hypothetical protein
MYTSPKPSTSCQAETDTPKSSTSSQAETDTPTPSTSSQAETDTPKPSTSSQAETDTPKPSTSSQAGTDNHGNSNSEDSASAPSGNGGPPEDVPAQLDTQYISHSTINVDDLKVCANFLGIYIVTILIACGSMIGKKMSCKLVNFLMTTNIRHVRLVFTFLFIQYSPRRSENPEFYYKYAKNNLVISGLIHKAL